MQRRSFLKHAAAAAAAASVPLSAFATRVEAKPRSQGTGYGPLVPALDETTGLPLLIAAGRFPLSQLRLAGRRDGERRADAGRARRYGGDALAGSPHPDRAQSRARHRDAIRQRGVRPASQRRYDDH